MHTRYFLCVEIECGKGKTHNRVESGDFVHRLVRREFCVVRPGLDSVNNRPSEVIEERVAYIVGRIEIHFRCYFGKL